MTIFKDILKFLFILLISACNAYKTIAKGNLSNGIKYNFNSVDYFGKNCSEFVGVIRAPKRIQEEIVYYSCSSLTPIKILFSYNQNNKVINKEYFVSVTEDNFDVTLSENEKQLLTIMNEKKLKRNYGQYKNISGFRKTTEADNIFEIPIIKKGN